MIVYGSPKARLIKMGFFEGSFNETHRKVFYGK